MSWEEFFIIFGVCVLTMLACRVIPLFVLKGKELPEKVSQALNFIPPAAFAALVANDLLSPGMFESGLWSGLAPLISAALVAFVGLKTKSLIWCVIVGIAAYALLSCIG